MRLSRHPGNTRSSGAAPTSRPSPVALVSRVLGAIGVIAYNWWIHVLAHPGAFPLGPNAMFSDLQARTVPHSLDLRVFDIAAGILLTLAFLLQRRHRSGRMQQATTWMVLMGVAVLVEGLFPYQCPEGLSSACRHAEWTLQLPVPHYVHVISGIVEFGCATATVLLLRATAPDDPSMLRRCTIRTLVVLLLPAYVAIAVAYLSDHGSLIVEPVFLLMWSATMLVMLGEPMAEAPPRRSLHP